MSYNNVWHLITSTTITLQHFATLHLTSPNYTSLHLPTLHFLSFTFHYPLIWLNPFKLGTVRLSHPQTYFQNNEPLHCPKEPLTISLHFFFNTYPPVTSLPFTFYFLSPSLPPLFYTFLTLVLKIRVLPWEDPIAPSGSWFQSVTDLFTKEYFPMSVLCFLALIFQWRSTLLK